MTDSSSAGGDSFDLDKLQQLVEMMEKHDLREVQLRRGDQKWMLKRGPQEVVHAVPMGGHFAPAPVAHAPAAAPAAAPSAAAAPAAKTGEEGLLQVKSPMVGTFYSSPQPGEPAFVKVGDRIKNDSVVCLIEAMKFFNPVKSDCAGSIAKICVKDGDAVEFGQLLFLVQP
ncbi:MAG: acetyl-CoA carboxylase biotin carboxyl carrier protein [Planctomycetaceae bacterium]